QRTYSEETAREVDCAVRRLVGHAFDTARALLAEHRELLEQSAQRLIEQETLDRETLLELFARFVRPDESAAAA
ncbi:MAG TPA: hypothetical protein VNM90_15040, partial [Haliangium sp.]|nr:hypothetical protein [Haliangium sp.]